MSPLQECIQSATVELSMQQTVSHLLVSTRYYESVGLFYFRTEPSDASKYAKLSGYDLWHRRLRHCRNENICRTIPYSIGLNELHSHRFDPREKCPACMMVKSHFAEQAMEKEAFRQTMGESSDGHIFIFSYID
jgi:hypothetical protein